MASKPDPQLLTRARGALLAHAAGSRLSTRDGTEGKPAALTRLFAESLLERHEFVAADVSRRWVHWMDRDGRGLGLTTRRALELMEAGVEPFDAGRRARDLSSGHAPGSGAVMRCLPVALRFHNDPDRLLRVATQQAAMTDSDPRALWSAAAVCLAARELLHGNAFFTDEVVYRLRDRAPRPVLDALYRAPRIHRGELPLAVDAIETDAVRCIEIAFWSALHERSLEGAMRFLSEAGGDTAGNTATAGGLLGARDGEGAIPQTWLAKGDTPGIAALAEGLVSEA